VAPLTSIEGCVPQFGTGASLYGIETRVKHDVHASESGGRIDRERLHLERLRIRPWLAALKP
jgi:hypothetical protein